YSLSLALVVLILRMVICALTFILYNLHDTLANNTIIVTIQIHSGATKPIHSNQHLLRKRVIGTTLWTLPIATGLTPVCALTDLPYYGSPTASTLPCIIVHGAWSLGYIILFTIAILLAIGGLWKLWLLRRPQARSWSLEERYAAIIHFARLMILF